MQLAEEVRRFSSACERLLATAAESQRHLTEDEIRVIEYYCKEMLTKFTSPSKT